MKYLKYIIAGLTLITGTFIAHAAFYPIQTQSFQLIGSGAAIGNTTLSVQTFNDTNGNALTMSNFGSTGYGTIEPNNGSQEENISFTTITNNANGTVTLGNIVDYALNYPYATSTGITINHAGGSTFVLSNSSIFYYNNFAIISNPETVSAHWIFSNSLPTLSGTPATSTDAVNKNYVDTQVGNVSSSSLQLVPSGQNVSGNNTYSGILTFTGVPSFVSGATFSAVSPTTNVVCNSLSLTSAICPKSYIDGVAIAGAPTAGNTTTGIARSASSTQLNGTNSGTTTPYFIPSSLASSTASTTSIVVVTNSQGKIDGSFIGTTTTPAPFTFSTTTVTIGSTPVFDIGKNIWMATTSGSYTFTMPTGIFTVKVELAGAGGGGGGTCSGGGSCTQSQGGIGGVGGACYGYVSTTTASAVYTVVIGSAGSAGSFGSGVNGGSGGTGGKTYMSDFCTVNGGSGSSPGGFGGGGTATASSTNSATIDTIASQGIGGGLGLSSGGVAGTAGSPGTAIIEW